MNTPNNTANDRLRSRHDGAAPQPNPSLLARGSHALQNHSTDTVDVGVAGTPPVSNIWSTAFESITPASDLSFLDSDVPLFELLKDWDIIDT